MMRAGTIEITVPDCPVVPPNVNGIPSWVVGSGMGVGSVLVIAFLIAVVAMFVKRQEERTKQKKLDGEHRIALAKQRKACITCGAVYDPELKVNP